jgi:hypothetical protein
MINMRMENVVDDIKFMDQSNDHEYPGGLKIYLTQEEIKRLNLDPLPALGSNLFFKVQTEVVGLTKDNLDLQITDMGIMQGATKEDDGSEQASDTLYQGPSKPMKFVGGGF